MPRPSELTRVSECVWQLPITYKAGMNVPGRVIASESLINSMDEGVFEQLANVARLPGIVKYALCMPDGHKGYGFPIGAVAAMDSEEGVISPGGIGFDINCGMRLVMTNLTQKDIEPYLKKLVDELFKGVPAGVGGHGLLKLSRKQFKEVIEQGAQWCVKNGYGWQEDLERTEEGGRLAGADPSDVSERAIERGYQQLGTLGSGNHYLEIQVVRKSDILDPEIAKVYGITLPDQVGIMFHCGSRGFGHQIATDYLQSFLKVMKPKYHINVADRDLACAPFSSPEGKAYFSAMKCAANISFANRQLILYQIRRVFAEVFGKSAEQLQIHQVYDVSHNTAKLETHTIDGEQRKLLVHRKGSTRAFGPKMPDTPQKYQKIGQPVIIGGSMETGSYLLAGLSSGDATFYSTTHGSGRVMSRRSARKLQGGRELQKSMESRGIYTRTSSYSGFAEEGAVAYKKVDDVVEAAWSAGISRPVARFTPLGNVKG
ncbi:RtcB family protein [Chitinispirillales bacterium ANBcel5]|uniref:RtcB family protein n=1 Tax=Cellulosispirillum alkaliphilum TaxID=3039283 RepID=UPI002A4E6D01|nr:RtcB family protein [Chitinispirillales bacterium ANBcel5]